jgi:hypothetical protein
LYFQAISTFSKSLSLFLASSSSLGTSAYVQSMVAFCQFSRREDNASVASLRMGTSESVVGCSFAARGRGTNVAAHVSERIIENAFHRETHETKCDDRNPKGTFILIQSLSLGE